MEYKTAQKKSVRKHLLEAGLIFLAGFPAAVLFCGNCWSDPEFYYYTAPFSGLVWVMLWKGNELVFAGLDRFLPWHHAPLKRLFVNILAVVSYTMIAMTAITYLSFLLLGVEPRELTFSRMIDYSGTAVVIAIFFSTFLSARGFFLAWRDLAIQNERLQKESISSQYEALKQQVNPHFLFNSLNVLTNLVYEDPDLSAKFIKQLSNVYRYVLDAHAKEVISLDEELEFVRSYAFLQQMRYGERLRIVIDTVPAPGLYVPPLALQMLIENAVKHNEISDEHPLCIQVRLNDDTIVVSNKRNSKEQPAEDSTGIGLNNIRSRYALLSGRPVVIEEDENEFTVTLPALYKEE